MMVFDWNILSSSDCVPLKMAMKHPGPDKDMRATARFRDLWSVSRDDSGFTLHYHRIHWRQLVDYSFLNVMSSWQTVSQRRGC